MDAIENERKDARAQRSCLDTQYQLSANQLNERSRLIVHSAVEVHKHLGPGLLESVYEFCLLKELRQRGMNAQRQVRLPVIYKGEVLGKDFYIDILVDNQIVIELKCVESTLPVHKVQLLTYLKLSGRKLGLLLNFNVPLMKDGIYRLVNNF